MSSVPPLSVKWVLYKVFPQSVSDHCDCGEVTATVHLVYESSALGVRASGGCVPEPAAEVDMTEIVGINVGEGLVSAGAVVRVVRKRVVVNVREMLLDHVMALRVIRAEPGRVTLRRGCVRLRVRVCSCCVILCGSCGVDDLALLGIRAFVVGGALSPGGARGNELARE